MVWWHGSIAATHGSRFNGTWQWCFFDNAFVACGSSSGSPYTGTIHSSSRSESLSLAYTIAHKIMKSHLAFSFLQKQHNERCVQNEPRHAGTLRTQRPTPIGHVLTIPITLDVPHKGTVQCQVPSFFQNVGHIVTRDKNTRDSASIDFIACIRRRGRPVIMSFWAKSRFFRSCKLFLLRNTIGRFRCDITSYIPLAVAWIQARALLLLRQWREKYPCTAWIHDCFVPTRWILHNLVYCCGPNNIYICRRCICTRWMRSWSYSIKSLERLMCNCDKCRYRRYSGRLPTCQNRDATVAGAHQQGLRKDVNIAFLIIIII
jgi:hypothetical protein